MNLINGIDDLRGMIGKHFQGGGRSVGFVPTMGFLHEGHLELIRKAKYQNDLTVISIFVNPLQFGPDEDFDAYPRDPKRDRGLAASVGVDLVFEPTVQMMYPKGISKTSVDVGRIAEVGEGAFRPGHFNGVATVCSKLFSIVGPCRAYFGQKDAQQIAVIKQVVSDLDLPVEVIACPTVREPDGLAMSSRNSYLNQEQRAAAAIIPRALFEAQAAAAAGESSSEALRQIVQDIVAKEASIRLQYVHVADSDSFEELTEVSDQAVVALAAFAGKTRLIDNVEVTVGTPKGA